MFRRKKIRESTRSSGVTDSNKSYVYKGRVTKKVKQKFKYLHYDSSTVAISVANKLYKPFTLLLMLCISVMLFTSSDTAIFVVAKWICIPSIFLILLLVLVTIMARHEHYGEYDCMYAICKKKHLADHSHIETLAPGDWIVVRRSDYERYFNNNNNHDIIDNFHRREMYGHMYLKRKKFIKKLLMEEHYDSFSF